MIEVVAAVIKREGQLLICQRPVNKKLSLLWEFPGGKVEEGEEHQAALYRECLEELGIELLIGSFICDIYKNDDDVHISFYNAIIKNGIPVPIEHNDIRWICISEISKYTFCPADEAILKQIE